MRKDMVTWMNRFEIDMSYIIMNALFIYNYYFIGIILDVRIYVDGASKEYTLMIATEQHLKATSLTRNNSYFTNFF